MKIDNEEKVTKLKIIPIKAFHKVHIGDPYYYETNKGLNLTIDKKLNSVKTGALMISEIQTKSNYSDDYYKQIIVDIALSPFEFNSPNTDKICETYLKGYNFKDTVKKNIKLACDTARYEIALDDNFDEISTGADGYYGNALIMKQYFGFDLELFFDGDLFTFEDIEKEFKYLCEEEISQKAKEFANRLEDKMCKEFNVEKENLKPKDKYEALKEFNDRTIYALGTLPSTDGNFKSAIDRATKEQIQTTLNILNTYPEGNKSRISALNSKLKKIEKEETKIIKEPSGKVKTDKQIERFQ